MAKAKYDEGLVSGKIVTTPPAAIHCTSFTEKKEGVCESGTLTEEPFLNPSVTSPRASSEGYGRARVMSAVRTGSAENPLTLFPNATTDWSKKMKARRASSAFGWAVSCATAPDLPSVTPPTKAVLMTGHWSPLPHVEMLRCSAVTPLIVVQLRSGKMSPYASTALSGSALE
jgi:hypothetical protein